MQRHEQEFVGYPNNFFNESTNTSEICLFKAGIIVNYDLIIKIDKQNYSFIKLRRV